MKRRVRIAALCLVTAALAFVYARGFSIRETPPLVKRPQRQVLRLWVSEEFMGSLSCLTRAAARFEKENPGVSVHLRRAQAEEYARADAVLPDAALYMPGVFTQPEALFTPFSDAAGIREAFAAAGKWQGQIYGLPVLAGAYGLMVNDALYDGTFTLEGIGAAARPAQGKKQAAVAGLDCPQDAFLCFPAALLAQGGALLGGFPQGIMREAGAGVLAEEFAVHTRESAFTRFAKGQTAALLCTQREVRRMSALEEAGKGFAFSVCTPQQAFCDQILFYSVVRGENEALAVRFAAFLLEETFQHALTGYGFFSVTATQPFYAQGEMPRLYAMEQGILSDTLLCMNAYAGEKQALEAAALDALENGGKDLMTVPFY